MKHDKISINHKSSNYPYNSSCIQTTLDIGTYKIDFYGKLSMRT